MTEQEAFNRLYQSVQRGKEYWADLTAEEQAERMMSKDIEVEHDIKNLLIAMINEGNNNG